LTESRTVVNINSVSTNAAWNAASYTGVNIVEDLMEAKMDLYNNGYNPEGAILLLSPLDHKSLLTWLIDGKGSSIPSFASAKIETGVVMEILGLKVVVNPIVTADYAAVFVSQQSVKVKELTSLTTGTVDHVGIGREIRIWLESIALLEHPKSVALITNTQA
jgi:hypothetical protein